MLRWKLRDYLSNRGLSAYALTRTTDVAPNTVYALARGDSERVSLEVLDKVLAGLERLTGEPVSVTDLLEREGGMEEKQPPKLTAAGVPYTGDEETDWWLDNQPDILERIKRFENGETTSRPLREIMAELELE